MSTSAPFTFTERKMIRTPLYVALAVISTLCAGSMIYARLSDKLADHESRLSASETQQKSDHDLLTRIDARTEEIKHSLERLERRP